MIEYITTPMTLPTGVVLFAWVFMIIAIVWMIRGKK